MTNLTDLATQRLINQQLMASSCTSVAQVVQWMGAMQAQDYDMAKWGIGVRLPGSTESLIEEAIDRGELIRTHLLRPTWHFVAATDVNWLLDLTAPHVSRLVAGMNRRLELDEVVFRKSRTVIEKALEGNTYLTRVELMSRLQTAGIKTNDLRSAHLMFDAELTGLVCNGPRQLSPSARSKQHTYALLRERVPNPLRLSREEALAELAKRYFSSHGPATLKDFVWWSGLTVRESRKAIELAKPHLFATTLDAQTYWQGQITESNQVLPESIHFLPAFDEFMVSYCDRSASLNPDMAPKAITSNGIFRPIIVVDGQVVGLWKRTLNPKNMMIELTFFYPLPADLMERIREKANDYARYMQTELSGVA